MPSHPLFVSLTLFLLSALLSFTVWLVKARLSTASFTATMFSCSASRASVSTSISLPVRLGML